MVFDWTMHSNGGSEEPADPRQARARHVARELEALLMNEVEYRRRWVPRAARVPVGRVSYTAVARVLVDWWFETGEREWAGCQLPVDLVRRALLGECLAPRTLDHLIRAFDMRDHHCERLWSLYCETGAPA